MRKSRCRGKLSLTFRESAITIKTGTIGERTIMKITYIHHSTFCVEVAGKALVFDYYNGKGLPSCEYHGKLPDYPKETQIYVFASHSHRDHFDTEVLSWSRHYPDIHYIFAKEVKKKLGNSMLKRLGFGEEIKEKKAEGFWKLVCLDEIRRHDLQYTGNRCSYRYGYCSKQNDKD